MSQDLIAKLKFNDQGLIPAVVQDAVDGEVLMVAYMDREAVEKSLATGKAWFYSRSRQKLWLKGETSGHFQEIKEIYYDCDADTLLLKVNQTGGACHEGYRSCFYRQLVDDAVSAERVFQPEQIYASLGKIMAEVFGVIQDRKITRPEGSYTAYLFDKGLDKILKKVGEETAEVIIAAKNNKEELVYETADLLYHLMVLLAEQDLTLEDIARELAKRR